jgi:acyl carrier protein
LKIKVENKIKNIMSNIFKVNINEINDESSPQNINRWDSLRHISLILALEEEFKIKFSQDEISTMVNYKIIYFTIMAYID